MIVSTHQPLCTQVNSQSVTNGEQLAIPVPKGGQARTPQVSVLQKQKKKIPQRISHPRSLFRPQGDWHGHITVHSIQFCCFVAWSSRANQQHLFIHRSVHSSATLTLHLSLSPPYEQANRTKRHQTQTHPWCTAQAQSVQTACEPSSMECSSPRQQRVSPRAVVAHHNLRKSPKCFSLATLMDLLRRRLARHTCSFISFKR